MDKQNQDTFEDPIRLQEGLEGLLRLGGEIIRRQENHDSVTYKRCDTIGNNNFFNAPLAFEEDLSNTFDVELKIEEGNANNEQEEPLDLSLPKRLPESPVETYSHQPQATSTKATICNATTKRSVLFDTVTVYHFTRSQGFNSIPSEGGSTLGMERKHFLRRILSVDLFEEVRRRSRREILLEIILNKNRNKRTNNSRALVPVDHVLSSHNVSTDTAKVPESDASSDGSLSDHSDISDSKLTGESYIFLQPLCTKLRRSLLKASGVRKIDPAEKLECNIIRRSRERCGCKCVNECNPELCECTKLGVNCLVDRFSFPCGCSPTGCRNPLGRTEFDVKLVNVHRYQTLFKVPVG